MVQFSQSNDLQRSKRNGVAVAETAILLPAFVLIVFAAIECSNALFLQQSLTIAAYEAASVLSEPTGSLAAATSRCEEILEARKVNSFALTADPLVGLSPGDVITVDVTAPASAYSIGPSWFFQNTQLTATVYVVRAP